VETVFLVEELETNYLTEQPASAFGAGGGGAGFTSRGGKAPFPVVSGGAGSPGIVIVEEFY